LTTDTSCLASRRVIWIKGDISRRKGVTKKWAGTYAAAHELLALNR
jgi:hypothetical protein